MKRLASRIGSSSRFLLSAFVLLLAALGLVLASTTWAQSSQSVGSRGDEPFAKQERDPNTAEGQEVRAEPVQMPLEGISDGFDYEAFLEREKNGEISVQAGRVFERRALTSFFNVLINNNAGSTGTSNFTQSEVTVVAFGNNVVAGFNDSGSNAGGTNKFTGFSRSTDGGLTWTDGGTLPTNASGDVGDPVLARNETTGRIYFATLQFSGSGLNIFRSDDGGATWSAPVDGSPGKTGIQNKPWIAVDNFAGSGNGNVYLIERDFGAGDGIFFFRSTDGGLTFGPSGGSLIVSGKQGAFVAVGPDHAVYAFWYDGTTLQVRKSTDLGITFGVPLTVVTGLVGGVNGDLGLTGIRQGTATPAPFRSNEFPHAAVNPASGNIYVTYDNDGPGVDKADVFLVQSLDGGATWSAPVKVNDDATTTDQWQPTLAVSTDGSRLGVFYYSRQEDPAGNNLFKYYGRLATISGSTLTFLPSFAVSDTASLPEFGRDSVVNPVYMGDYNTAFATPGLFHVVWSDNRDNLAGGAPRKDPNVYYAKIPLGAAGFLTDLSPAKMWVGLANSDDVGLRLDLLAEVFIDASKVGQGELHNVATGSSGFNNAILNTISLGLTGGPAPTPPGSQLSIRVSARRTCFGGGHASGRPRLWYNGQPIDSGAGRDAGSRFDATIGGSTDDEFLRTGLALNTAPGAARTFADISVNSSVACPARPFTSWGTWVRTLP